MSWYLTIRGAPNYSQFTATPPLLEFLPAMPELRQTGPVTFGSADGQPWVAIIMAAPGPNGNYATDGEFLPRVNVVELVCSRFCDKAWYDVLASRIAVFLGWSAFEEHEGRLVWPPVGQSRFLPHATHSADI